MYNRRRPLTYIQNYVRSFRDHIATLRAQTLYGFIVVSFIVLLMVVFPIGAPNKNAKQFPDKYFDFRGFSKPKVLELPEIKKFCAEEVEWQEDVYIDCYRIVMGAFNAINKLQNCIRWAWDAGAGIVVPTIIPRDKNLSFLYNEALPRVPVEFLLDEKFLWKIIRHNCPQMKIVNKNELGEVEEVEGLWGDDNGLHTIHAEGSKGSYKDYFEAHLKANFTRKNSSKKLPIVMRERDSLGAWNVLSDPVKFQIEFHSLIHFSEPLVKLAESMLEQLPYEYFGLHMRAESDWINVPGWPTTTEIAQLPVGYNTTENPILFVACGDPELLQSFKQLSKSFGIRAVDKWDLVPEKDAAFLNGLAFDQLGIVDYLVLVHSRNFWGYGGSSFSHSVALARHIYQFQNLNYDGNDFHQQLIGPKWVQPLLIDILW